MEKDDKECANRVMLAHTSLTANKTSGSSGEKMYSVTDMMREDDEQLF